MENIEDIGYNTKNKLIYKIIKNPKNISENYNEYGLLTDDEFSNLCYQDEILYAFNLESYDDDIIAIKMLNIFNILSKNPMFLNICTRYANLNMSEEPIFGFTSLFSYDYFYITHAYICEVFNDFENYSQHNETKNSKEILMKLEKKIFC